MSNPNKKPPVRNKLFVMVVIAIIAIALGVTGFILYNRFHVPINTEYSYMEFKKDLADDNIDKIVIEQSANVPTGRLKITLKDESRCILYIEDVAEIVKELKAADFDYKLNEIQGESVILSLLPSVFFVGIVAAFYFLIFRKQFGDSNNKKYNDKISKENSKITFHNVAGMDEEKHELEEVVSFLKTPEKYTSLGAKIPKGVLLVGPPGTGKTLLAKAVAGEAEVPFFHISGSEFEEMFVGLGASRVRKLFAEAKKVAPSIIFIDEIDAVARKRSSTSHGNDTTAQTLNQILVEMDGFEDSHVIVIAATNRIDILDPAIVRAGRFDRKVFVNNPDVSGREAILNLHAENKKLADDVDLKSIAATTVGFSGADLENLLNEAAILASGLDHPYITNEDINKSLIKVGVGTEKKSKVISEKERKITAYHESGHALLFHLLPEIGPIHMISVVPTGNAGGYTMPLPENDEMYYSKTKILNTITASFGGRVAEEIIFGEITTGASQDIAEATHLARDMVIKYGMSDLGPVNLVTEEETVLKPFSEDTAKAIDKVVLDILNDCHTRAKEILTLHITELEKCANELLGKEKLTREEFEAIMDTEI